MHMARFRLRDRVDWGILDGDQIRTLTGIRFEDPRPGAAVGRLSDVRLLAPIEPLNKVVGIAVNYGEKGERDGPGIFMKQPGTVIGHLDPIVYPRTARSVIHEAELGIVIGRTAQRVPAATAMDHVLGYTCVNDVSGDELLTSDAGHGTSMRVKHFDTFCPIGPVIATGLDGDNLGIQCVLNGKKVVEGSTSDMLWGVAELVAWVSEVMALYPGDVISSGCPDVGEIKVGDTVEMVVEGIGTLRNPVVAIGG